MERVSIVRLSFFTIFIKHHTLPFKGRRAVDFLLLPNSLAIRMMCWVHYLQKSAENY